MQAGTTDASASQTRRGGTTLAQLLVESVRRHAANLAVIAPNRTPLTYAGLGRQIEVTALALAEAGYTRGSRIAVAVADGPEFAVALLAACAAATCAPLNHKLDEAVLEALLSAMHIDAVVVGEATEPAVRSAARRAGIALLQLRVAPGGEAGTFDLVAEHRRPPVAATAVAPDDVALVTHTSGTISAPKIVPLEHWRLVVAARDRAELGQLVSTDRVLLLTPLYAVAGIKRSLLAPLAVGGAVVCPASFDGRSAVDVLETLAPTICSASPAMHIALLEEFEHRAPRPRHWLRLIFSSHAELRAPVQRRLEQVFGVPVIRAYGMTEAGNIAQAPLPPGHAPAGSVGRPSNLEVAIADETGRLLGPGREGEILVRGAEVFGGYENDDAANRAAFRGGWFRTGDCGHVDRDGFVYLSGRIKEMINRGGAKIAPRELEEALERHPAVAEAAAFAMPHPTLGEAVAAAVVVQGGDRPTAAELRHYARSQLPAFKVPTRVLVVERLPRGALGKVDRKALAAMADRLVPTGHEPPADAQEAKLAGIFAEVLGVAAVGRDDSFFDLGGDSLRGVRVLVGVEQAFGLAASLDLLIDHPSVAEFAAVLRGLARPPDAVASAAPPSAASAANEAPQGRRG